MFSQACVRNSVHWGGVSAYADTPLLGRHSPPGQHPQENIPLGRHPLGQTLLPPIRPLQRTVRILLGCILVIEERSVPLIISLHLDRVKSLLSRISAHKIGISHTYDDFTV